MLPAIIGILVVSLATLTSQQPAPPTPATNLAEAATMPALQPESQPNPKTLPTPVSPDPQPIITVQEIKPSLTFRDGKFYNDDQQEVLKIAHLLIDFTNTIEVQHAISLLPIYKQKNYNSIQTTFYWEYFDTNWDGRANHQTSLRNARNFLLAIEEHGFYTVLSFETYPVGGSIIGEEFFRRHPSAQAKNYEGRLVFDNEYMVGGRVPPVPSIFDPNYLRASRQIVRDLMRNLPMGNVIMFETTVEPQYIGNQAIDYSDNALIAFNEYSHQELTFETRPHPHNRLWNEFRAKALANWVDEDAKNIRLNAPNAVIAVDFLYTGGIDQIYRLGDPRIFLAHLTEANVLQINWHYGACYHREGKYRAAACNAGYNLAKEFADTKKWGLMEHMSLSGDLAHLDVVGVLNNSIANGNTIGWHVVNAYPKGDVFSAYYPDMTPKGDLGEFDDNFITYKNQLIAGVYIDGFIGKQFREFIMSFANLFPNQTINPDRYTSYRNMLANRSCQTVGRHIIADSHTPVSSDFLDTDHFKYWCHIYGLKSE